MKMMSIIIPYYVTQHAAAITRPACFRLSYVRTVPLGTVERENLPEHLILLVFEL
jgi:hypothetical protein